MHAHKQAHTHTSKSMRTAPRQVHARKQALLQSHTGKCTHTHTQGASGAALTGPLTSAVTLRTWPAVEEGLGVGAEAAGRLVWLVEAGKGLDDVLKVPRPCL